MFRSIGRSEAMKPAVTLAQKWAVVLVHGVGDTEPGAMLAAVGPAMAAGKPGLLFPAPQAATSLYEVSPSGHVGSSFPAHSQAAQRAANSIQLTEVHWADLTRVGVETHNLILSLVRFIYGIRHLVLQAALIPGKAGWGLNAALRTAILTLQGPIYSLYLFEAVLCIIYLAFLPAEWDEAPLSRQRVPPALALLAIALIVISALRWRALLRSRSNSVLWPSLLSVGLATLIHSVVRMGGHADMWYAERLIPRLNVPRNTTPGDWPLLIFIIDLILDRLLFFVAFALIIAGVIIVFTNLFYSDRAAVRSTRTAWLAAVLLVALWQIAVQPIDLIAQWSYDKSRGTTHPKYTFWFNELCLVALAVSLAIAALMILVRQTMWANRNASTTTPNTPAPRLIIAFGIQLSLTIFGMFLFPLAVIDGLDIVELRIRSVSYGWVYALYLAVMVVLLSGSVAFRNVLHILADIVIHFAGPGADRLLLRSYYAALRYPVRRRIANRLRAVLNMLLAGNPTHLLIIAHSQGTMIVLEELRKKRWHGRLSPPLQVTLLTFGSPMTHLYQHYFPLLYNDLTQGRWRHLRANLPTWVNLYRIDDYIGTHIDSPAAGSLAGCWPQNLSLPPGMLLRGHTQYWESAVFHTVAGYLP
jgi:hypothetical protein